MRFSSDTLLYFALIAEIMLRISCRPLRLPTPEDADWPGTSNSSFVTVDHQQANTSLTPNGSFANHVEGNVLAEERNWKTYYTPENISLLLDAIVGDGRGDWRAGMDEPVIIWSHESKHHPNFGKYSPGIIEKETLTSRYMSFLILGVVIAFIVYAYLNHLFAMRLVRKLRKRERLRRLVQQSAFIMATSANAQNVHVFDGNGRRLSILNLFHAFHL